MNKIVAFAALILVGAAPSAASAMSYSWRSLGKEIVIDASGKIEANESLNLAAWVEAQQRPWGRRRATAIVFDSPGGIISGAESLGRAIAALNLTTGVAHNGMCASACVMAWSAGWRKSAATDSRVGVHMAAYADEQIAADGTLLNAQWLKAVGAPSSVIAAAVTTPPGDIYWLSLDELRAWNARIIDESDRPMGSDPAVVSSEPTRPTAPAPTTPGEEPAPRTDPITTAEAVAGYCHTHPTAASCQMIASEPVTSTAGEAVAGYCAAHPAAASCQ